MNEYNLVIKNIYQEALDIIILELAPLNQKFCFDFSPGQYVMITYRNSSGVYEDKHAFSLACSPINKNSIRLGIKIQGFFTQGLKKLQAGQEVLVSGPYGQFVFDEQKTPSSVFIAGGIGITPFISYLEYAADKKLTNKLYLIYSAKSKPSTSFLKELTSLECQNPNLSILYVFSEEDGRLTSKAIINFIGDIQNKSFYLCGPIAFMNAMTTNLYELNVSKKSIFTEAFSMIPDSHYFSIIKNIFYTISFALLIFIPVLYLIIRNSGLTSISDQNLEKILPTTAKPQPTNEQPINNIVSSTNTKINQINNTNTTINADSIPLTPTIKVEAQVPQPRTRMS